MSNPEIRELEAFLALAEELHFGRAGERLYLSQSRISQLLRALESRIGGRLVDRTSRRVRLTPLGEQLHAGLRPAFDAIVTTIGEVRDAARGLGGVFRVGFQGTANDAFLRAVAAFRDAHPECAAEIAEIPLSDPFGAVHRGEVDAAVVLTPVRDDALVVGPVFSTRPLTLAVSDRHPYARRDGVDAEELADGPLIGVAGAAPEYWRLAQAPVVTPRRAGDPVRARGEQPAGGAGAGADGPGSDAAVPPYGRLLRQPRRGLRPGDRPPRLLARAGVAPAPRDGQDPRLRAGARGRRRSHRVSGPAPESRGPLPCCTCRTPTPGGAPACS
ncbi:HTH-type transcriptional regulator HdfR [Streptomyces californicus]